MWYTLLVGKKPKSPTGIGTQPEALERQGKRVQAIFFRTEAGGEPLRDWLKDFRRKIGNVSGRALRLWDLVGLSGCRSASRSVTASTKCGRAWLRTELRGCFSISTRRAGWSCYMDSLRKRGRHRTRIWTWRAATRIGIKGDCNECKEKSQENGPQWVNL